jgi:hypothetical protein
MVLKWQTVVCVAANLTHRALRLEQQALAQALLLVLPLASLQARWELLQAPLDALSGRPARPRQCPGLHRPHRARPQQRLLALAASQRRPLCLRPAPPGH